MSQWGAKWLWILSFHGLYMGTTDLALSRKSNNHKIIRRVTLVAIGDSPHRLTVPKYLTKFSLEGSARQGGDAVGVLFGI